MLVHVNERLPAVRMGHWPPDGNRAGSIHRDVARPIGIGTLGEIAQLVRLVMMTVFEHRAAGHIPNSYGRFDVGGIVVWIVAKLTHEGPKDGIGVRGKKVGECAIRGVADGALFVRPRAFGGRPPQRSAQLRPVGAVVVRRPCVVHARVHDGQRPRCHRRA